MHNTWNKAKKKRSLWQQSLAKIPTEDMMDGGLRLIHCCCSLRLILHDNQSLRVFSELDEKIDTTRMSAHQDINDSLQECGIRRDVDVCQLSLATKKLPSVPDLSRFHFLRELWLNNNKLRELSCRSLNCCLTELYLHNNNIKSISGALNHLTCLRLLFLHNNQIRRLEDTMLELRRMQQLQTATFFLNPISHEPGYRHRVIHCLPSIQVLDRKEVKSAERRRSFQTHSQERHCVLQSVAFCRRAP